MSLRQTTIWERLQYIDELARQRQDPNIGKEDFEMLTMVIDQQLRNLYN